VEKEKGVVSEYCAVSSALRTSKKHREHFRKNPGEEQKVGRTSESPKRTRAVVCLQMILAKTRESTVGVIISIGAEPMGMNVIFMKNYVLQRGTGKELGGEGTVLRHKKKPCRPSLNVRPGGEKILANRGDIEVEAENPWE